MGEHSRLTPTQLCGFVLWRTGLSILAAYSLYRSARWALRHVDLPPQLDIGLGLVIAGSALVMISLIWERVLDARAEGDLTE